MRLAVTVLLGLVLGVGVSVRVAEAVRVLVFVPVGAGVAWVEVTFRVKAPEAPAWPSTATTTLTPLVRSTLTRDAAITPGSMSLLQANSVPVQVPSRTYSRVSKLEPAVEKTNVPV